MKKGQIKSERRQIAIYSRKSKFTGKGESIENQIELCRRYIENMESRENGMDGRISGVEKSLDGRENGADEGGNPSGFRIYEDEGFSGKNLERPQFRQMMRDARKGEISQIVVYRLDRISRNIGDFAGLIEELNQLGVSFVSIKEQFDTSSPMGRAMMYIASVFSQLERETIAERIRDNMLELAKTGRWLGGKTPTGYVSESISTVTVEGRTKKCCKLKVVESEAEVVREIFSLYLQLGSLKGTAQQLAEKGWKTRAGKSFTAVSVRAILSNPVYAAADEDVQRYFLERKVPLYFVERGSGIIAYNRTLQRSGKTSQIKPIEEWIVAAGRHQPLVSGKDWVQVQLMLEKNGGNGRTKYGRESQQKENENFT